MPRRIHRMHLANRIAVWTRNLNFSFALKSIKVLTKKRVSKLVAPLQSNMRYMRRPRHEDAISGQDGIDTSISNFVLSVVGSLDASEHSTRPKHSAALQVERCSGLFSTAKVCKILAVFEFWWFYFLNAVRRKSLACIKWLCRMILHRMIMPTTMMRQFQRRSSAIALSAFSAGARLRLSVWQAAVLPVPVECAWWPN